jgi:hypothetical protein
LASSPRKAVYTPKGVLPHAALLHQACAHCGKFLAAASRRSRGRVSVPVWLIVLSDQLRIIAMVGRYPAIQLIRRSPLPTRCCHLSSTRSLSWTPWGIARRFRRLSPGSGQVSYVLLTRPPRSTAEAAPVRLACIRHAASVYPEPGSNSPSRRALSSLSDLLIDCITVASLRKAMPPARCESRLSW